MNHSQKAAKKDMVCSMCRNNAGCDKCIDVVRMKLGKENRICTCMKDNHSDMVSGAGVVSMYTEFKGVRCPSPGIPEGWQ